MVSGNVQKIPFISLPFSPQRSPFWFLCFYPVLSTPFTPASVLLSYFLSLSIYVVPPRWWFHLIVVRGFEYARDPESYTSGSVATGRVSLAGQVKG